MATAQRSWRSRQLGADLSLLLVTAIWGTTFVLVKQVNRLKTSFERPVAAAAPTTKDCPFCATAIPIKASRCPNCTSPL